MLKVIKNDWRNGWNSVKTTLIAAVALSVILGIAMGFAGGTPQIDGAFISVTGEGTPGTVLMIASIVWFGVMLALLVMTVDAIVRNMSTRMFGAEGYLTHTLPVETWELLAGKALGTWIFGVFMVVFAIANVLLVVFSTAASTGLIGQMLTAIVDILPKLGTNHLADIASGFGYLALGILGFLAWSLLIVIQYQFICIAARQFGKYHIAGGVVIFFVLVTLEGRINDAVSMGFVVCLVTAAACFCISHWLLKHRLSM